MNKIELYNFVFQLTPTEKEKFFNNKEFVEKIINYDSFYFCMLGKDLCNDKEYLEDLIERHPNAMAVLPKEALATLNSENEIEENER